MISKRFVFTAPRRVEWQELALPDEPGPGQVLLEAQAAVVSAGTDVSIYTGTHINVHSPAAPWPKYPHSPGGHVAGRVFAVGSGVADVAVGERLVFGGGYTRFHLVEAAPGRFGRLPDGVSFAEAALASHSTVSQNGIRSSHLVMGESVVVFGLGLIGQYAVQYARLAGAAVVVGVDPIELRRGIAAAQGADLVLHPEQADVAGAVKAATRGRGADVIIEATGAPEVIPVALKLAHEFSRVILLGSPRGRIEIDPYNDLHRKSLAVIGSNAQPNPANQHYPWTRERNLEFALDLVAGKRLRLEPLVTDRLPAEESLGVWETLVERPEEHLGVVLQW